MAEHLTEDDLLRAQEEGGTALAVGGIWDFTGPDVTIADNSGLDKTVVTIGAGSVNLTLMTDNWVKYGTGWNGPDPQVEFGAPYDQGAGLDFIGGANHDPTLGRFQLNKAGLYVVNLLVDGSGVTNGTMPTYPPVVAIGTTEYDSTHQIRWEDEISQWMGPAVLPGYQTVAANVNFTTSLVADDVLFVTTYGVEFQGLEYNYLLYIARIA
jgi:hypothetical protein